MTMEEAIAQQPAWVGIWLNWLFFGAFILPLALLIWKKSRLAGLLTLALSIPGAAVIFWMYEQMGYVKLLGLPHIIIWTPLAFFFYWKIKDPEMPVWPKRIMVVILVTILISLAFDYVDVARYILGERDPFPGTI